MSHVQSARAWAHVIGSLSGASGAPAPTPCTSRASARAPASNAGKSTFRWPADVKIHIIERVSDRSVAVAWSHSCQGSFGAQVWRESVSHSVQVCAFSGDAIARGDAIYKPIRSVLKSSNARFVVLKTHLEALIAAQCVDEPVERSAVSPLNVAKSY